MTSSGDFWTRSIATGFKRWKFSCATFCGHWKPETPILPPTPFSHSVFFPSYIRQSLHLSIQDNFYGLSKSHIYSTVNRGDFGQIFSIFINIFIMMNSILGFIWGLVSTMQEHRILYTLNSSGLLYSEIFYLEPCPKSPWSSGWLWTHQHIYGFPK